MTDFFDWLTASDSGLSADRLAERFRLSHEEMRRTSEALAPAFMLALQKAMLDPAAWSDLMGRFAAFMPGSPLHGGEMPTGRSATSLLDSLFGSKALTEAVARQVSMASGIAPDTVQKLMPGLAVMTMEATAKMMMANFARNQPPGLATGDYPGALAEMMRRGANAVEAMNRPSGTPAAGAAQGGGKAFGSDYLEQMFAGALKGGFPWAPTGDAPRTPESAAQAGAGRDDPAAPNPFLPFAAMAEAFARGMQPQSRSDDTANQASGPPAEPEPRSDGGESAAPGADPDALIAGMMRSGRKLQDDYAREMMALFERYHSAGKPGGEPS